MPAGTVKVREPKTAGHEGEPFYPQSLERGRSVRAVMLAVAEMYIKGVSTREVKAVMCQFDIESLSYSQVSRATKMLDENLKAWGNRPLGEPRHVFLDARYEKGCIGAFPESLQVRGLRGVEYVVSDDHAGLRATRRAVLDGARWQRCQFHLAQNAIYHVPNAAIRKRIDAELRAIWDAPDLQKAQTAWLNWWSLTAILPRSSLNG